MNRHFDSTPIFLNSTASTRILDWSGSCSDFNERVRFVFVFDVIQGPRVFLYNHIVTFWYVSCVGVQAIRRKYRNDTYPIHAHV